MKASRLDLDKVGAYASALCAVHCVLTGVALGLLSVLGLGFVGSPITEAIFFIVALGAGTAAMIHGIRKHGSAVPASIFAAGVLCLLVSHFVFGHGHEDGATNLGGPLFSVLGGLSLICFHVLNLRLARSQSCGCGHCR